MGEENLGNLLPRTRAYAEIWLDQEKVAPPMKNRSSVRLICRVNSKPRSDPAAERYRSACQRHELRGVAENGKLVGFNLLVGGGLSINTATRKPTPARRASLAICR